MKILRNNQIMQKLMKALHVRSTKTCDGIKPGEELGPELNAKANMVHAALTCTNFSSSMYPTRADLDRACDAFMATLFTRVG